MISFPFDSQISGYLDDGTPIWDRAKDSQVLARMLGRLFGNGVFPTPATGMQVIAGDGTMEVIIKAGSILIDGHIGIEDQDRTLQFTAASSQDRIDRVVARLDLNISQRDIDLYIIQGTPGSSPVAPSLTFNSSVHELCLANVFIPKNTNQISNERIVDTRLDSEVCGLVVTDPDGIDTSEMFHQIQAAYDSFVSQETEWQAEQKATFDTWFAALHTELSGDVAGNLQNQLDSITVASDVDMDSLLTFEEAVL